MPPRLSVIIPVYNRVSLLDHPLVSLREAQRQSPALDWELLVVDDGSTEDVPAALARFEDLPVKYFRRKNSGLLAARLFGLQHARGEALFFLDADDAITPGKFIQQLSALFEHDADVVHGDMGRRAIDLKGCPTEPVRHDPPAKTSNDLAPFYLEIQPAPHDPIFRRIYLLEAITHPVTPPQRDYDAIAEAWFYYQLSVRPAHIHHQAGVWSIVGEPEGARLSGIWERQCAAAWKLMHRFMTEAPATQLGDLARRTIAKCAFHTWRGLPRGFPFAYKLLDIWRQEPTAEVSTLGGRGFTMIARGVGPVMAGQILKILQRPRYRRIRTIKRPQLDLLFE